MQKRYVRVLLIEDDPDDAFLIEEMLSSGIYGGFCDFQLQHEHYLSKGTARLAKGGIDVVLLDLALPDSLGMETLRSVHAIEQNVPIIVLTGLSDEGVGIEAIKNGAQDYLVKGQIEANLLKRALYYAIERKKVEEKLRYLSMHDALTGLYNRAYFEEEMSRLKDARHMPVTMIICDIDDLKQINDSMGHAFGDQMIINVARLIQQSIREGNVVSRIGGDEFAVVLPKADETVARSVCTRIKAAIDAYNQQSGSMKIGLSIGYAVKDSSDITMMELFEKADNSMYLEKASNLKGGLFVMSGAMSPGIPSRLQTQ